MAVNLSSYPYSYDPDLPPLVNAHIGQTVRVNTRAEMVKYNGLTGVVKGGEVGKTATDVLLLVRLVDGKVEHFFADELTAV